MIHVVSLERKRNNSNKNCTDSKRKNQEQEDPLPPSPSSTLVYSTDPSIQASYIWNAWWCSVAVNAVEIGTTYASVKHLYLATHAIHVLSLDRKRNNSNKTCTDSKRENQENEALLPPSASSRLACSTDPSIVDRERTVVKCSAANAVEIETTYAYVEHPYFSPTPCTVIHVVSP